MPRYFGISERATGTRAVNDVKQLLLGCRAYAADNEGRYPPNLKVLYPDYVDYLPNFEGHDEEFKNKRPMIYYPGLTEMSDPNSPTIEHPFTFHDKKVIAYLSGNVLMEKPEVK